MNRQVVVRFAPSPTGYLHIGGARTAVFNWLYAKKHRGRFILRIEDTDAERSTPDAIQGIMDGLKWLGISWDQGPDFQSHRMDAHLEAAHALIESGHAYPCFCSKEAIEEKRRRAKEKKTTYAYDGTCRRLTKTQIKQNMEKGIPYAVRLKVPRKDGGITFEDAVYGTIHKAYKDIEDFILVRSNGKPLYVLCNAVDDIHDKVTHIIRGQDGLANTPKQILLYQALSAPLPVFAHMSLTLDPQKAKISKRRHGEMVAVHFYRENGFLPWAFVNFLVLLGWATSDSKEIFSESELINAFELGGISKVNSVFNIHPDDPKFFTDPKALNINAHYIKTMPHEDLYPYVKKLLKNHGLWDDAYESRKKEWFLTTIDLIKERFYLLTDFVSKGRAYFSNDYPIPTGLAAKHLENYPELEHSFLELAPRFRCLEDFTAESVEKLLRDEISRSNLKANILVNGLRVILTGQEKGPDFIKSMLAIGRDNIAARLEKIRTMERT